MKGTVARFVVVVCLLLALPAFADEPAMVAEDPTTSTAPEFKDTAGPVVIDLSIAADNPASAPVVTTMLRDDVGVASAVVHWRTKGQPWQQAVLVGGTGPLRIARLPDGPQRTGFSMWIEAKDDAGNMTHVASEHAPLEIKAAVEGNSQRVTRETAAADVVRGPDPGWVMLALATGIAAGAGSGIFFYDMNVIATRSDQVNKLLGDDVSAARRQELEGARDELQTGFIQDAVVATTLGVVGVAGLVTGVTLLVFAAAEQ